MGSFDLQPNEADLWDLVLDEEEKRPRESINIVKLGKKLGLHPQRSRQFARTWSNRGWVNYTGSGGTIFVIEGRPITTD